MRICLFTDTLGDVNGVSRFIRNIADQSLAFGHSLHVLTSTRFECPNRPNIVNVTPRYSRAMPGYAQLELAIPPFGELARRAEALAPDAVHISTPGPVGTLGRRFARRRNLPLLGTYHTDFPAYIDHLFNDRTLTWITDQAMRRFYRPFRRVFTRSTDYAQGLVRLGIPRERIVRLLPGIDTDTFHTRFRDPSIWSKFPDIPPDAVKAMYVGRVSVEKNLPLLAQAWKRVAAACRTIGLASPPHLVVIGDGPYRTTMEHDLAGERVHFLGFRHGVELSTLYASSDFFLFPSTTDTLGQVVMEAQSAGLPVVVTDQGGPREVVNHAPGAEQSGFVVSADAPQVWADVIARLASDRGMRTAMGAAGHRLIQPMSIRHSFEHFWEVHRQAVEEARAG